MNTIILTLAIIFMDEQYVMLESEQRFETVQACEEAAQEAAPQLAAWYGVAIVKEVRYNCAQGVVL